MAYVQNVYGLIAHSDSEYDGSEMLWWNAQYKEKWIKEKLPLVNESQGKFVTVLKLAMSVCVTMMFSFCTIQKQIIANKLICTVFCASIL